MQKLVLVIINLVSLPGILIITLIQKVLGRTLGRSEGTSGELQDQNQGGTLGFKIAAFVISAFLWLLILSFLTQGENISRRSRVNACRTGTRLCQLYEADIHKENNSNAVIAKESFTFVDRLYPLDGSKSIELSCKMGFYCYEFGHPENPWTVEILVEF